MSVIGPPDGTLKWRWKKMFSADNKQVPSTALQYSDDKIKASKKKFDTVQADFDEKLEQLDRNLAEKIRNAEDDKDARATATNEYEAAVEDLEAKLQEKKVYMLTKIYAEAISWQFKVWMVKEGHAHFSTPNKGYPAFVVDIEMKETEKGHSTKKFSATNLVLPGDLAAFLAEHKVYSYSCEEIYVVKRFDKDKINPSIRVTPMVTVTVGKFQGKKDLSGGIHVVKLGLS